jgi:HEAT repeat protein
MEKARPECRPAYLRVLRRFRPAEYPKEFVGEMMSALIWALGSRDGEFRCQVSAMLGDFGHDARGAIPALLAVLDDPGEPGIPGPGNEGFSGFRDPAIAAAGALRRVAGDEGRAGPSGERLPAPEVAAALIRLMRAPTAGRRLAAVYALASLEADDAIVGAFIEASRDGDDWVRCAGLQALQGCGSRLRSRSLEVIREALEDGSSQVRYAAARALLDFGTGVEPMVPALIRHAESDVDRSVRVESARALGSHGPPAVSATVLPLYLEAIERPGAPAPLRENLIRVLIDFGPAARGAVPAIARVLRSAEQEAGHEPPPHEMPARGGGGPRSRREERIALRRTAARALGALAPGTPSAGDAVSALVVALDDPAAEVGQQAVESLVAIGPAAKASVPALLEAMHRARGRNDLLHAGRMAEALGRLDPAAPGAGEAIAFLEDVLRSDEILPRLFAERVLVHFGPAAAPAIPDLVALAGRPAVRASLELPSIATALGRIAPGTPAADQAVAVLLERLRAGPESTGIEAVIDALARFGPGAAAALPRLRELTKSDNPPIAEAARNAVDLLLKAES